MLKKEIAKARDLFRGFTKNLQIPHSKIVDDSWSKRVGMAAK